MIKSLPWIFKETLRIAKESIQLDSFIDCCRLMKCQWTMQLQMKLHAIECVILQCKQKCQFGRSVASHAECFKKLPTPQLYQSCLSQSCMKFAVPMIARQKMLMVKFYMGAVTRILNVMDSMTRFSATFR